MKEGRGGWENIPLCKREKHPHDGVVGKNIIINIKQYGHKKLYQARVSSSLFSRFVTSGGKCSLDALDPAQPRPHEEAP